MVRAIINLLLSASSLAVIVGWIVALIDYDGKKPCSPEDCKTCPFPRCKEDKHDTHRKD